MNLVVVGAGKVGETLIKSFLKEKHDITVIDMDAAAVTNVVNRFDVRGIVGSGLERDALVEADVESADFFIACTSRDETNILSCVLSRKLGAKCTVARVRDPEYFKEVNNIKQMLGLDYAFNPELATALEISQRLKFPSATSVESFVENQVAMVELEIEEGNPIAEMSLKDVSKEYGGKVLISVVQRDKECFIPGGDFVIKVGDCVHVISSDAEINAFCKKLKIYKRRAKNVFIIGGGKIAYYLAKELTDVSVNVKIVEKDKERAQELAGLLPKATVLLGDGTDQTFLDEENMRGSDAFVTLTGMDEENVIISLYAKQKGISKVVTKVDRTAIVSMVEKLGLDAVVSPKDIIANHIVSFVRAHQAETGSGINTLYKLHNKVEALEFTVQQDFVKQGIPLKAINLRKNVLIGGIVRGKEYILPKGDSVLVAGDRVIVVSASKQITELEQILK